MDIVNYQDLMTEPSSSIIDFYPHDFELDLNGKKQDWEAIVSIPFIDEKRLLEAMRSIISPCVTNPQAKNIY